MLEVGIARCQESLEIELIGDIGKVLRITNNPGLQLKSRAK